MISVIVFEQESTAVFLPELQLLILKLAFFLKNDAIADNKNYYFYKCWYLYSNSHSVWLNVT